MHLRWDRIQDSRILFQGSLMADKQTGATAGDDKRLTHLLDLTAQIISSHASSTSVASEQLPGLIDRVFGSLKALNLDAEPSSSSVTAAPPTSQINGNAKALAAPKASRRRKTSAPPQAKSTADVATKTPRRARAKTVAPALASKPRRASRGATKAAAVEMPVTAAPATPTVPAPSADGVSKTTRRRKSAVASTSAAVVSTKRSSRAVKAKGAPARDADKPRRKARSGAKATSPSAKAKAAPAVAVSDVAVTSPKPKPVRARKGKTDAATANSVAAPIVQPAVKRRRASKAPGEAVPSTRKVRRGVVALAITPPAAVITPSDEPAPALAKRPRRKLSIVTKV